MPGSFQQQSQFSGRRINDKLGDILMDNYGLFFTKSFDKEFNIRDIKEQCCYVGDGATSSTQTSQSISYRLPSGQILEIGRDALTGPPELIFGDSEDVVGIQHLIHRTIKACPMSSVKDLSNQIVLCGGSTCFQGFDNRLLQELKDLDGTFRYGFSDELGGASEVAMEEKGEQQSQGQGLAS